MFAGVFKCGGNDFLIRTKDDFEKVISKKQIDQMFIGRYSHTTGMLLASSELAAFVHLPDASIEEHPEIRCDYVKGFPAPEILKSDGLPLGINTFHGMTSTIHIPNSVKNYNLYMIGTSTFGKSTSLIHQILYRAMQGYGIALLDFQITLLVSKRL